MAFIGRDKININSIDTFYLIIGYILQTIKFNNNCDYS